MPRTMSRESYEAAPYPPAPFVESHPSNLQTIATVLGLDPPAIETARVLELGCATGGNIVPMAAALPEATFVGVDYSPRQIEQAQRFADAVSATNLRLEVRSILDIDRDFGTFDYIIAHGVFSWVPPDVQEKLLSICRENLAERGVAYVSFNAYPGWHILMWLRDMMLLHAPDVAGQSPQERVRRARQVLDAVLDAPRIKGSPLAALLSGAMRAYDQSHESHFLHDLLEEHNQPISLRDFVARAAGHGLQYLADAHSNGSFVEESGSRLARPLLDSAGADWVLREQYLDFLRNTSFRRALLVHAGRAIDPGGIGARIDQLYAMSSLRAQAAANGVTQFIDRGGAVRMSTGFALTASALSLLERNFPTPRRLDELLTEAEDVLKLGPNERSDARQRAANELIAAWMTRAIDFHVTPPPGVATPTDRPEVWKVARHQASLGQSVLTNLRHEIVRLNPADRGGMARMLLSLDGTRTTDQIVDSIASSDRTQPREAHAAALRTLLSTLAQHALLVS
jgi:SAM-dependent methyltransferase